ncbi:MAG: hypothetical protein PWQ20_1000 [Thermotogaceae bacterium]|nr:hypothetical protein [Thermotogaceae bacterium]
MMNNQRPICPKCGSTNIVKNGHDKYHNQQFLCKDCSHSFKLKHTKKTKNFSFTYPKCPLCGKAMEFHKIRRGFVVFRCRPCHFKDRIQIRILLNKFFSRCSNSSVEFITDGLGAYTTAVNLFFKNINHVVVGLGGNNQCESKFSLFKDFIRLKRCFKKFDNLVSPLCLCLLCR